MTTMNAPDPTEFVTKARARYLEYVRAAKDTWEGTESAETIMPSVEIEMRRSYPNLASELSALYFEEFGQSVLTLNVRNFSIIDDHAAYLAEVEKWQATMN